MNNKNLDRLFQEKLKNLEASPNKRVWNDIESKLKKKKRKVIPIWWYTSGVAALFLLGLLLFPFSEDENKLNKDNSKTIITEKSKDKIQELKNVYKTSLDSITTKVKTQNNIFIADKKETKNSNKKDIRNIKKTENKKKLVSSKNAMEKNFIAGNNSIKTALDSEKENSLVTSKKEVGILEGKTKVKNEKLQENKKIVATKNEDLNKFLEKKDSVFSSKTLQKKWSVAPVFAVLNSNSFSNSSPLDKGLSNSTKGNSTVSYGFQIGYQINKKWTIQSGIHIQEMSFTNNHIAVVSSTLTNSPSIVFNDGDSFSFESAPSQNSDFTSFSLINTTTLNGDLKQKYGYVEIPVEVKYSFLNNKKFNTQIVAGFSSLFLNKNEINLSTEFASKLGKAKNLNSINFSGNLGFDFNYFLNKSWSLNLNPMFKTQLNTFSNNSNGFAPFNIGIYSGIKYNF